MVCCLLLAGAAGQDGLDALRSAVPGEPGEDYPVLATFPDTPFSCQVLNTLE